jgi:hypothetical protein
MIFMNGLGDGDGPIPGTDLPSSDLLLSSDWGTYTAPAIPDPPASSLRVSSAGPPVSPSELNMGPPLANLPAYTGAKFPPPTKGGETLFGITLPSWMPKWAAATGLLVVGAFATDYVLRHFVGGGGRHVVTNPKGRKRRPRVAKVVEGDDEDGDLIDRAAEFREKFHWGIKGRKRPVRRKVSKPPKVATKLGELVNVTYKTKKRGEKAQFFVHEFGEEGGRRPTLAMDIENKKLHIVGGSYDVTADGIKD